MHEKGESQTVFINRRRPKIRWYLGFLLTMIPRSETEFYLSQLALSLLGS